MSENTIIKANGQGLQLATLADYIEFANIVSKSGLAPASLNTPEKVLVCLQMGAEVGLSAMQSLQSIAIINGVATIYGDAGLALVRKSGLLQWIKEEIEGSFNTNLDKVDNSVRAVCTVKRKGDPEPVERSFSVIEAKLAGLWGKRGPWCTHPQRMLKYKARAFCLRDVFPDVLKGLHVTEEMPEARIAVESTSVTVSSQALLEGPADVRAEGQSVQPVPEQAEKRGEEGPRLPGTRNGAGSADVDRRLDHQEQGRLQDIPERESEAKEPDPECPAGDGRDATADSGRHPVLMWRCTECGRTFDPATARRRTKGKETWLCCPNCESPDTEPLPSTPARSDTPTDAKEEAKEGGRDAAPVGVFVCTRCDRQFPAMPSSGKCGVCMGIVRKVTPADA